ncbi:hypothetical protein C3731_16345 [Brucella oryzae]|uniref:Uncharacterized protein n=1 Tax=Brucella oryzae TaxID=335286 RepID=A0A2S7IWZ2_9HYPH|nr:hypothetical protein C3731_16345 [Brucella oryzae]
MKNMVVAVMRNQNLLPYSPIPLTYCLIALLPYCPYTRYYLLLSEIAPWHRLRRSSLTRS